jgi:hypothetical protein
MVAEVGMTDCDTCSRHSGLEADIKRVSMLIEERKELMNVRMNQLEANVKLAKEEMDRRLEGMNGLEARTTARTSEAEGRVRDQTAAAERKLAEQAAHFITRTEVDSKHELMRVAIAAELKVLDGKLDTLVESNNLIAGSRKVTDWLIMALIAGAITVLSKLIHL